MAGIEDVIKSLFLKPTACRSPETRILRGGNWVGFLSNTEWKLELKTVAYAGLLWLQLNFRQYWSERFFRLKQRGGSLLPRINWMREKFCKHLSTNEEHGFECDQVSAGKSYEQIHKQCSNNQVWIVWQIYTSEAVFLGLLPRKCALGLAAGKSFCAFIF